MFFSNSRSECYPESDMSGIVRSGLRLQVSCGTACRMPFLCRYLGYFRSQGEVSCEYTRASVHIEKLPLFSQLWGISLNNVDRMDLQEIENKSLGHVRDYDHVRAAISSGTSPVPNKKQQKTGIPSAELSCSGFTWLCKHPIFP